MTRLNKRVLFKAVRYTVPGFIVGAAVTVLAMLLVFISIGALGLPSPLMGLFPAVFCALLGAMGFNTGVSVGYSARQPLSDEDFEIQMLAPAAGFISGGIAVLLFRLIAPGNSLYVGIVTLALASMVLIWFFFSKKAFKTREQDFYKRNARRYIITGAVATIALSLLSWSLFMLAAGIIVFAFALLWQRRTRAPSKIKEPGKPKKHIKPKRIALLAVIAAIAAGLGGWYLFPYVTDDRWALTGFAAIVSLLVFITGAVVGLYLGRASAPPKT